MASFLFRSGLLLSYFCITFLTIRLLRRCEIWFNSSPNSCIHLSIGKGKLVCGSIKKCVEDRGISDCNSLITPSKLSGRLLKMLLHQRGITSYSLFEKEELVRLLEQTGPLSTDEVRSALKTNPQKDIVTFESSAEFIERVQDSVDSVWLLRVLLYKDDHENKGALPMSLWKSLMDQYASMGVNFGVVDCTRLPDLCSGRDFDSASLILAVPRGTNIRKIPVILKLYYRDSLRGTTLAQISKWLNDALLQITEDQLKESHEPSRSPMKLALSYNTCWSSQIPLVLPFLAIRFAERFKISMLNECTNSSNKDSSDSKVKWVRGNENDTLAYSIHSQLALWPFNGVIKRDYTFGSHLGEWPTFECLSLLLTWCYPEKNDIFMFGLYWCGLTCILQFFCCGHFSLNSLFRRIFNTLWTTFVTYVIYLIASLPIVKVVHYLVEFTAFHQLGLLMTTWIALSDLGITIRGDIVTGWWSASITWPIFLLFGCFISIFYYYRGEETTLSGTSPSSNNDIPTTHERHRSPSPIFRRIFGDPNTDSFSYWSDVEIGPFLQNLGHIHFTLPMEPYRPSFLERLPTFHYPTETRLLRNSTSTEEDDESNEEKESMAATRTIPPSGWPDDIIFCRQCIICLDKYHTGDLICHLPCGHAFHDQCVKTWLYQNITRLCPVCRWPAFKAKPL